MLALPEKLKEIVVAQLLDAGPFKFKQRVLSKVHIDSMHTPRTGQQVIKCVAARGGNYHHRVLRRQLQRNTIQGRILPARVVNQVAAMHELEALVAQPTLQLLLHERPFALKLLCF